jgi:hypothetical protein
MIVSNMVPSVLWGLRVREQIKVIAAPVPKNAALSNRTTSDGPIGSIVFSAYADVALTIASKIEAKKYL